MNTKGRVTIPTDMDAVPETLDLLKRWGADAIRDCDGTEFPQELKDTGAKIYATYYTTRKDNAWAKANPDETQQCYIMTPFYTAEDSALTIPLMTGISRELMKVNDRDDITRWWEVIDRTTGEPLDAAAWHYDAATESVVIDAPAAYHEYTVSFLAYLIWDPVHMYNSVINDWKDVEHQIPFDVRQPKTHAYTMRRLREYGDPCKPTIWDSYKQKLNESGNDPAKIEMVERFAFYERAHHAYAIIATGESAIYANVLLKKGVVQ